MRSGMGLDGFVWFEGVIEDRMDPLGIGRMRVRAFGWDTDDRSLVPTESLPWAYPMLPLNSSQGEVHSPKEGTWVLGFFRDGDGAQDRVILGTINTGAYVLPPKSIASETAIPHLVGLAAELGEAILKEERLGVKKISEHSAFGGYFVEHVSLAHAEDRAIDVATGGSHADYGKKDISEIQAPIIAFIDTWALDRGVTTHMLHAGSGGETGENHQNHIHVEIVSAPLSTLIV